MINIKLDKVQQLQYALACFEQLSRTKSKLFLIWETDRGFATFNSYQEDANKVPIISRKVFSEFVDLEETVMSDTSDMFAVMWNLVYTDFHFNVGNTEQFLIEQPDILLEKLLQSIKSNDLSGKKGTDSTTVWNVSFLESRVTLPFLDFSFLGNVKPISLVSENSTDSE